MGRQDFETETETLLAVGGFFDGSMKASAHVETLPTMQNGADTPAGHNARSGNTKDSYIVPVAFSNVSDGSSLRNASDICDPITTRHGDPGMVAYSAAFQESQAGVREYAEAGTLRSNGPGHDPVGTRLRIGMAVRRLTPTECSRLQGFRDGYLAEVMHRKKLLADGPQYKLLGNSMAVPVMRWLAKRIIKVDAIK